MGGRRVSVSWLSDEMARALAAMCPPLSSTDVLRAADELTRYADAPDVVVIDRMFRLDVDRVNLCNLIEALRALREVAGGPASTASHKIRDQ